MNKLTIQINNLEALERLIGGDTEVEIDIRNAVVQTFADKHLKALANSDAVSKTLAEIKADIAKQIKDRCESEIAIFKTNWAGSVSDVKLNPSILQEINSQVRNLVDDKIRTDVDEALKTWRNDEELKRIVDKRFEYYTTDYINGEIRSRLEKLKAKL